MSEKLTREELKKDQFLETAASGVAWAKDHALAAGAGAIVLVVILILAVRIGGNAAGPTKVDVDAERALATARTEFARGGLEAGIPALEGVRTKHSRSRAAREATYLLANSYMEAGDYAKAEGAYQEFLNKPLYNDLLVDGATLAIAACREEAGDHAAAAERYQEVWKVGRTPAARIQGALGAARAFEVQGKNDPAIAILQEVRKAYPDAPESEEAKFALARLGVGAPLTP